MSEKKLIRLNAGSLSTQDNAREIMKLIDHGNEIFNILIRYDDLLTLEHRPGYEPGCVLSLMAPFLVFYGITENDIKKVSSKAKLTPGAKEFVRSLKEWHIALISTSYYPHVLNLAKQLKIPAENISATKIPLDLYTKNITSEDKKFLEKTVDDILNLFYKLKNEDKLKAYLDNFFLEELPNRGIGSFFGEIRTIGGARETSAFMDALSKAGTTIENSVVLGNNITDYKLLDFIRSKGGISVVFNGDEYAVPYASFGVASESILDLKPITDAFLSGGKKAALELLAQKEKENKRGELPYFNMIEDADLKEVEEAVHMHKKAREILSKI